MKLNDIYRWSYNSVKYAQLKTAWNDIYWATSQICICKQDVEGNLYLEDTYWYCGDNKRLEPEDVDLEYLGNFEELDKFTGKTCHYNSKDLVDINHRNNPSGNTYIKKGAKKCIETIRAHIKRQIEEKEYRAKSAAEDVIRYKEVLENLSEENLDKVWI